MFLLLGGLKGCITWLSEVQCTDVRLYAGFTFRFFYSACFANTKCIYTSTSCGYASVFRTVKVKLWVLFSGGTDNVFSQDIETGAAELYFDIQHKRNLYSSQAIRFLQYKSYTLFRISRYLLIVTRAYYLCVAEETNFYVKYI